jgi:hypothetical protein
MDVKELQKAKIGLEAKPHDKDCKIGEGLTPEEEAAAKAAAAAPPAAKQTGGALPEGGAYLPLFLSMTLGLVIVSSIVISLRRLRQNAKLPADQSKAAGQHGGQETDEPPQPGHTRGPTPV